MVYNKYYKHLEYIMTFYPEDIKVIMCVKPELVKKLMVALNRYPDLLNKLNTKTLTHTEGLHINTLLRKEYFTFKPSPPLLSTAQLPDEY